jgi:hypothetical protein
MKLALGVQVMVSDPSKLADIRKRETDVTKERIELLLNAGANVVLTTQGIDDVSGNKQHTFRTEIASDLAIRSGCSCFLRFALLFVRSPDHAEVFRRARCDCRPSLQQERPEGDCQVHGWTVAVVFGRLGGQRERGCVGARRGRSGGGRQGW